MFHLFILAAAFVIFCAACGVQNRERGTHIYNQTSSTEIGRVVGMGGIAVLNAALAYCVNGELIISMGVFGISFMGLMLWCTFGWDKAWSNAIGNGPGSRLWGVVCLGGHGCLLYLTFLALLALGYDKGATIGLGSLLMGIPYLIFGIPKDKAKTIPRAEYTWGACIGAMFWFTLT